MGTHCFSKRFPLSGGFPGRVECHNNSDITVGDILMDPTLAMLVLSAGL